MSLSDQKHSKFVQMHADFNDIVEQTYYFEQKLYEWSKKVDKNKQTIANQMGRKDKLKVQADTNLAFGVERVTTSNIEFMVDQLRKNLPKEKFKKVTEKKVEIVNLSGLIKTLKHYGIPADEFKRFIKTNHEVNRENLDNLIERGDLQLEDLQGCYQAELSEEIKIRKLK